MTYEVNWIDIVLLTVLGLSAIWGFFRGLIRGVFGILSLILSFFAAKNYGHHAADMMQEFFGESALTAAVGYVLVFVLSAVTFSALTYLLYRAAVSADLGSTDKMGGLQFGIVRGLMIDMAIVFLLAALPLQSTDAWRKSVLLPMFGHVIRISVSLPVFSDYREYWIFENGRPRLSLLSKRLPEVITVPEEVITPRSDEAPAPEVISEAPCESLEVNSEGVTITVLVEGVEPCGVEVR